MNPELIKNSIQAVIDGLTPLAQKLQVPIEGLWGWAIQHNYAVATTQLLPLLLLIPLPFAIRSALAIDWGEEISAKHILTIAGFFISFLGWFVTMINIAEATARFIAPQWMTIEDIANLIK